MPLTGLVAEARRRTAAISSVPPVNDERQQIKQDVKRTIDFSSEIEQAAKASQLRWDMCRHLKMAGDRAFCKRYTSLCAKEKCSTKYINAEERPLDIKRILRGK